MDSRVQRAFILLLRAGLWNSTIDSFDGFLLSYTEWSELYQMAITQTVEGLVFDAITKLPGQYQPPKEVVVKWVVRVDAIERENVKKKEVTVEIAGLFKAHHIDVTLLKGSSLAVYYTKPLLRLSGDVDLYFNDINAFKQANQLIKQRGTDIGIGALRSTFYDWRDCEIEHHSKLIDIVNPFQKSYLKKLEKQETTNRILINLNGMKISSPSLLITHIQVNAHILKHFLGFGIGLRQFCDVARLYLNTSKSLNGEELKSHYKKLGIYRWMELIHCFLVDQLGLNAEFLPYQIKRYEDSKWLMNDVIAVGNFGFHGSGFVNGLQKQDEKRYAKSWVVLPRLLRAQSYARYEALWFPISKAWSTVSRKSKI
ncbi:nucleotidyltransferase family protein [Mucilaginibacter lappiensis]|uniref:Nucleotidyltransferase n=1 Tax=Mucilaginibacter lappiensis TaxID=354630 RepID=A0A841JHY6_9SPHI|nr:nucleotidyltransferase family protein [Mucilaginibacter lappiensis]MBB6130779.1 hypothetical protein [Mucilaginibacter lappiensis]